MRTAENWKDYQLIDCSDSEKLEKWGNIILIRPDPQIIWKTGHKTQLWNSAHGHYHRSEKGGGHWDFAKKIPDSWLISYGDLKFNIRPTGFKHTGLFPEQAVNWDYMSELIKNAGRPINVLNLFAYTGGATLACANAGASVCHVDASKGMTNWAKENAQASGVADGDVRWIVDDCIKFVKREQRRENKYDIIILDPPSYGRGPKGEIWHLEECLYDFMLEVEKVLSDEPIAVILNSYTTGLSASVMKYILDDVITDKRGGKVSADEIGIPVSSNGRVLPCGSTAIWMLK